MKILDRYVTKNFLTGYVIAFAVLMGLRIMIDLFVNIDEFTEHAELTTVQVLSNIVFYYSRHSFLYFRDFSGMITVVAAVFSLGKMTKNNELVAIMSSGVSLKRVIALAFTNLESTVTGAIRAGAGVKPGSPTANNAHPDHISSNKTKEGEA